MRLAPLKFRRGDRAHLEALGALENGGGSSVQRARIVLLAADGRSNRDIAETVGLHYNQVGLWRKRYEEFGMAGL